MRLPAIDRVVVLVGRLWCVLHQDQIHVRDNAVGQGLFVVCSCVLEVSPHEEIMGRSISVPPGRSNVGGVAVIVSYARSRARWCQGPDVA